MTPEIQTEIELTEEQTDVADEVIFVRFLHITENGITHTVRLPQSARIQFPFDDDPHLRIEPGPGYEELVDADGLVEVMPFSIVELAMMGSGGLVLIPRSASDLADAKPPTQS